MPYPIGSFWCPHAIALERVFSWVCVIAYTEKLVTQTKVVWPPPQFSCWFPQAGICGEEHEVAHSSLQQNNRRGRVSSVMLTNRLHHPSTWWRHWQLCLDVFPQSWKCVQLESAWMRHLGVFSQPLECMHLESTQMRTQAVSISTTLTSYYIMKMA